MPADQYYLELENDSVASLDTETSTVTGLQYGETEIKLKDKSILYLATYDQYGDPENRDQA